MGIFLLRFKASLENVSEILFSLDDIMWNVTIAEDSSSPITRQVYISSQNIEQLNDSRGTANFTIKWSGSSRQSSVRLLSIKNVTRDRYLAKDSESWVPIVAFECRGLHLRACEGPTKGISVVSSASSRFSSVDFSSRNWYDYDANSNKVLEVSNILWSIIDYKK